MAWLGWGGWSSQVSESVWFREATSEQNTARSNSGCWAVAYCSLGMQDPARGCLTGRAQMDEAKILTWKNIWLEGFTGKQSLVTGTVFVSNLVHCSILLTFYTASQQVWNLCLHLLTKLFNILFSATCSQSNQHTGACFSKYTWAS